MSLTAPQSTASANSRAEPGAVAQGRRWQRRAAWIPLVTLGGLVVAKTVNETSFWVADRLAPFAADLDPDGAFAYITIHHLAQLAITLGIMAVVVRLVPSQTWSGFGFNSNQARLVVTWVAVFAAGWLVVQAAGGYLMVSNGASADPGYSLDARNVTGALAFQLLLTGTSEEPLFRGLIMTAMLGLWAGLFTSDRALGWWAIAGSTLVFMADHVNVSLAPLAITHLNLLQQATLLVFGLFYGFLFWRTGSLLGPIVAHGVLNVIIVGVGYVLFLLV